MAPRAFFAALLLAGFTAAKTCINMTIPVDISSRQGQFKTLSLEGNLDTANFGFDYIKNGRNYTAELLEGYQTLKGTFEISAKYCHPDSGSKGSVVQLLSHGIGFDKVYWDLPFNNYNYSYVEAAVKAGYSTLAIDRLGIGNSSHGDPFNTVQAQAEVEALNAITTKLRKGEIPGIKQPYKKVVHVGHSFGSVQSYWLSSVYPTNTDGIVLTGWSASGLFLAYVISAWNLHSARLNQPLRFGNASNDGIRRTAAASGWSTGAGLIKGLQTALGSVGVNLSSQDLWNQVATTEVINLITGYNQTAKPLDYPSGYLTWPDLTSNQLAFLLHGFYDVELGVLTESLKQPVTTGELLTIGSSPSSSPISGPVLVFTGREDIPFCGGDCYATGDSGASSIPAEAAQLFPNTSAFEAYIQPNTAHGLNAHYNSTAGYEYIQRWLAGHGLAA